MKLFASLALFATLAGCKSTWTDAPVLMPAREFMPGLQPARTEYSYVLCGELVPAVNGEFEVRDVRCRWLPIEDGSSATRAPANRAAADLMVSALQELPRERHAELVEYVRSDARIARALEGFDFDQAFTIWR